MNMNKSNDSTYHASGSGESATFIMPDWSEEDMEEIQDETPWEIFTSQIDNWAAINMNSVNL